MRKINSLLDGYIVCKEEIELQNLERTVSLKEHIKKAKKILNSLRKYVRDCAFETKEDEITFFKNIKPQVCADLIVYNAQLDYIICKPKSTIRFQKGYVKARLKKLENQKKKNIHFYRYYVQNETFLDDKYFLRGEEQLELFASHSLLFSDPEFCTSHDMKAAEVIANDLLVVFFKKEFQTLNNVSTEIINNSFSNNINGQNSHQLTWSASKTDLIELIYALKVSGALNGGMVQMKQVVEVAEKVFQIDLGNFYKTYTEIKSRNKDRTKFLNKLSESLVSRLEYEDSL